MWSGQAELARFRFLKRNRDAAPAPLVSRKSFEGLWAACLGYERAIHSPNKTIAQAFGPSKLAYLQGEKDGEGGNRTHDTTIFSRVLYQLSYLAWKRRASPCSAKASDRGAMGLIALSR